jgi:hypothetical protein
LTLSQTEVTIVKLRTVKRKKEENSRRRRRMGERRDEVGKEEKVE